MSSSRTLCRRMAAVLTVVFLAGFAQSARAETVLYLETFPIPGTAAVLYTNPAIGWLGYTGSACTPITASPTDYGGVMYSSAGTGYGGSTGYAYVRPAASVAGRALAIFTTVTEASQFAAIDRSGYSLLTFSWYEKSETGNGGATPQPQAQLAVKVGSTWYASGNMFSDSSNTTWTGKSIALSDVSSWYPMTVNASQANGLVVSSTATTLPTTGTINGAGLYVTGGTYASGAARAAFRFDNFQISGAEVPEPTSLLLSVAGLIGLLAYAWRKRK